MIAEQFRSLLRGKPFHPFVIHTASGETFPATHPEAVWQSPDLGETVLVYLGQGKGVVLIDIDQITECVRPVSGKRSRAD